MKTSRHSRTLIVGMATLCLLLGLALAYGRMSHGVFDETHAQAPIEPTPRPTLLVNYGHDDTVVELAVSPDGKYLLSGGANGILCVWEAASGRFLYSLTGFVTGGKAQALAFSPDGRSFAGVLASSDELMWDSVNGRYLYNLRVPGWYPSTVGVWDIATGRQLYRLDGHRHSISFLSFTQDSQQLISAEHGDIRRWDLHNPAAAVWYRLRHDSAELQQYWQLQGLPIPNPFWTTLSSDGRTQSLSRTMGDMYTTHHTWKWRGGALFCRNATRAAVLDKGTLSVFDLVSKRRLQALHLRSTAPFAFAMSPGGNRVAVGYRDGSIDVIDTNSGRVTSRDKVHVYPIASLTFSPDGTALFSGGFDHDVHRWVLATDLIDTYPQRRLSDNTILAANEDDTLLALGTLDGDVHVWDLIAGRAKYSFLKRTQERSPQTSHLCRGSPVIALHFGEASESLTSVEKNGTLRTWDLNTGQLLRSHEEEGTIEFADLKGDAFLALSTTVYSQSSPSGADESRQSVRLLDSRTFRTLAVQSLEAFPWHSVEALKFSPNEEAILIWTELGYYAVLFDGALEFRGTGQKVRSSGVMAVAPNGNAVSSALRDRTIAIHSPSSMEYQRVLSGNSADVNHLAFNHDGDRVVSSSNHRTVTLWDSVKFTQLYTHEFDPGSHPAIFSQSDARIVLIGSHGVSEIHDTDTGELLVSLAMYDDGEWVVWTPELLYNASDASELNLVLHTATGIQPLFDRPWMKQPDILQDFLSSLR